MIRPNERVLERLSVLKNDNELMGWLTASLEAYRDAAVMQRDDTELRIVQGKGQLLTEIIELTNSSSALIDKLRRA